MRLEKQKLARTLKNAEKKQVRLRKRAAQLPTNDLLEVYAMRARKNAALEEAKKRKKEQPEQPQDVSLPRKKQLPRMDDSVQSTADGVPVYAQPPFWAKSKTPAEPEEGTAEASTENVEQQPLEDSAPSGLVEPKPFI